MDAQKLKGVVLAVSSSAFIGASFIIKKKGLKRAGSSGLRAGTNAPPNPIRNPRRRRSSPRSVGRLRKSAGCSW
jgi:hypothetical protein